MTDFDAFLFRQQISDGLGLAEQLVGLGVTVLSFVLWALLRRRTGKRLFSILIAAALCDVFSWVILRISQGIVEPMTALRMSWLGSVLWLAGGILTATAFALWIRLLRKAEEV